MSEEEIKKFRLKERAAIIAHIDCMIAGMFPHARAPYQQWIR